MARAARAVRPDHAAPPDAAHRRASRRRGGRADAGGRAVAAARSPPTTPPGERFWYSNDGWKIVGACLEHVTGHPDPRPARRARPRAAGHAPHSAARISRRGVPERTAVGYEPTPMGPPAAAAAHAVAGQPDRLEHRRRLDRVDRARHGRLRAAAARAWRRARRPRRAHPARGDVRAARRRRASTTATAGRTPTACGSAEHRRSPLDGALRRHGGLHGVARGRRPTRVSGPCILRTAGATSSAWLTAAFAAVRASLAGAELPAAWAPPAPTADPAAADFVGRYEGDDGRTLEVAAVDDGLRRRDRRARGAARARPARGRGRRRLPGRARGARPVPAASSLATANGVVEAFHGPTWFRGERSTGDDRPLPAGARALTWVVPQRLSVEPGGPRARTQGRLGSTGRTTAPTRERGRSSALDDGSFAVGAERDPRRVRFEGETYGGGPPWCA